MGMRAHEGSRCMQELVMHFSCNTREDVGKGWWQRRWNMGLLRALFLVHCNTISIPTNDQSARLIKNHVGICCCMMGLCR